MNTPPIPAKVATVLEGFPDPVRLRLLDVRALIFRTAARIDGVGPLEETLKWGEPAYLTAASKSGTTIRLGWPKASPRHCAVYFNCQTSLVDEFRTQFGDTFTFEGNRALWLDPVAPLPEAPLSLCLAAALTYHRRK